MKLVTMCLQHRQTRGHMFVLNGQRIVISQELPPSKASSYGKEDVHDIECPFIGNPC